MILWRLSYRETYNEFLNSLRLKESLLLWKLFFGNLVWKFYSNSYRRIRKRNSINFSTDRKITGQPWPMSKHSATYYSCSLDLAAVPMLADRPWRVVLPRYATIIARDTIIAPYSRFFLSLSRSSIKRLSPSFFPSFFRETLFDAFHAKFTVLWKYAAIMKRIVSFFFSVARTQWNKLQPIFYLSVS